MRLSYLIIFCLMMSCSDGLQYHEENYRSFESMDALVVEIVNNIKEKDAEGMLKLLDNEALLMDLLQQSSSENAKKTMFYLQSPQGQRKYQIEQVNKKERIRIFLKKGIDNQLELNTKAFKSTGFELLSNKDYSEDIPAKIQQYRIRLDNADGKQYAYEIEVIQCRQRFHLIEASGFIDTNF